MDDQGHTRCFNPVCFASERTGFQHLPTLYIYIQTLAAQLPFPNDIGMRASSFAPCLYHAGAFFSNFQPKNDRIQQF